MGVPPLLRGGVPRLHLVTDDDVLAAPRFEEVAAALLHSGGARVAVHVRGPRTSGRVLYGIASRLVSRAGTAGAVVVVNDRVDVALAGGAGAVHLGCRSLPVPVARRLLGEDVGIGVSTHSADEVTAAVEAGADWIFAGTIYRTPSHPGRPGRGVEGVRTATQAAAGLPVLAIGGITPERVVEVRAAGGWGVAVVRGIWQAADPMAAMREYLEALASASGVSDAGNEGSP